MKTGTTLLLMALAGGLLAYVVFFDSARPGTREQESRQARVLHFAPEKLRAITIDGGGETIALEWANPHWMLKEPVKDRAGQPFVERLVALSLLLAKEEVLEAKAAPDGLKTYGLDKPGLRLRFEGGEPIPELLFGKETAVEGRIYVRLEGEDEVYVVANELRNWIARKADDFREPRLSDLDPRHIVALSIESAGGTIRLERNGVEWELRQPLRTHADAQAVAVLLRNLLEAQVLTFASTRGANLNTYGLHEPKATVTFYSESQDEPVRLELGETIASGDEKTPGGVYARVSSRDAVAVLDAKLASAATLTPNELRDRRLLRFEPDMVDRITLRAAGGPPVKLRREGEGWMMDGAQEPVDSHRVAALMAAVTQTPVSAFVANVASDLERYGLASPRLRITFSSYASHTTAESRAGELPIATVLFGKVEDGQVYAMVEGQPFIVAFPESILKQLGSELVEWRGQNVFQLEPTAVASLRVTYPAGDGPVPRGALALERDGDGWRAREGAGRLQPVEIESLVNTLAKLTALRWVPLKGAQLQEVQTIGFRTSEGAAHKLEVGKLTTADGESLHGGRLEGAQDGYFVISEPDAQALRLHLTEPLLPGETPPAPSPAPQKAASEAAPAG